MPNIENLLNRLPSARPSGKNRWMAKCPAHEDRSPSLLISDNGEKLGIHCFAGCGGADVLAAIGLDFTVLYPPQEKQNFTGLRPWERKDIEEKIRHEELIIKLYQRDKSLKVFISEEDKVRTKKAFEIIKILKMRLIHDK